MNEKAEQYIALAGLHKDLLIDRRRIEWRLTLAFWGALAAVTYALLSVFGQPNGARLGDAYRVVFWTLLGITVLFSFWHLPTIAGSGLKDMRLMRYFRTRAMRLMDDPAEYDEKWPEGLNTYPWWYAWRSVSCWHYFMPQALLSLCLFTLVATLLHTVK